MLKKLITILFVALLFGCSKEEERIIEYIDPVKDIFIFDKIDPNIQVEIKKVNNNAEFKNYQFKMLNKKIYDKQLIDINGEAIDLKGLDKVIIENLSINCEHCQKQAKELSDIDIDDDILFVQYFTNADKEEIEDLYIKQNININEDVKIVSANEDFTLYLIEELNIQKYPCVTMFNNGLLSFTIDEDINFAEFDKLLKISFENPIYENVKDCINMNRSKEDVMNSLSEQNRSKLASLDNDEYTCELTYNLMGKPLDFDDISNDYSNVYINEVDDFSVYKDSELVLIYTYLKNETETEKVNYINKLIASNDSVKYLVVFIEGLDSSSNAYKNMDVKFSAPVVSVLGYKPDDFFKFGLASYPTAVFVNKSTFTGAYSNIESVDKFNEAISMFLTENCIAYKQNN